MSEQALAVLAFDRNVMEFGKIFVREIYPRPGRSRFPDDLSIGGVPEAVEHLGEAVDSQIFSSFLKEGDRVGRLLSLGCQFTFLFGFRAFLLPSLILTIDCEC